LISTTLSLIITYNQGFLLLLSELTKELEAKANESQTEEVSVFLVIFLTHFNLLYLYFEKLCCAAVWRIWHCSTW